MLGVCEGECMGRSLRDEPLSLTRSLSCGLSQLYEAFEWWKLFCWNAAAVSLVSSAFDDTGFLGSPPRQAVYPPYLNGSTLAGNTEAEQKPTTFSSLLLFRDFLSLLFS